jgi:hypothetical protein
LNQEQVSFLQMYARGTPSTCSIRDSYTGRGNAYGICSARSDSPLQTRPCKGRRVPHDHDRARSPPEHVSERPLPSVSSYPMSPVATSPSEATPSAGPLRNGSRVRRKRFVKTVAINEVARAILTDVTATSPGLPAPRPPRPDRSFCLAVDDGGGRRRTALRRRSPTSPTQSAPRPTSSTKPTSAAESTTTNRRCLGFTWRTPERHL